jgi:hypothetical protein
LNNGWWKLIAKEALSNVVISTKVVQKLCFTTKNLRFDFITTSKVGMQKICVFWKSEKNGTSNNLNSSKYLMPTTHVQTVRETAVCQTVWTWEARIIGRYLVKQW